MKMHARNENTATEKIILFNLLMKAFLQRLMDRAHFGIAAVISEFDHFPESTFFSARKDCESHSANSALGEKVIFIIIKSCLIWGLRISSCENSHWDSRN